MRWDEYPTKLTDIIDLTTYEPVGEWVDVLHRSNDNKPREKGELRPTIEAGIVNALQEECGRTAREHGFTDDWYAADWLERLAEDSGENPRLINQDDIDKLKHIASILRNNIVGTKLALIHSEISEALESLRKDGGAAGILDGQGNVPEELADAIVRILDLGSIIKSPLGDHLVHKMEVNQERPHMHGKAM
jgi:hypothetical protein